MLSRRRLLQGLALSPLASAAPGLARAAGGAVYAENGLALRGTDPMSYFTHGEPRPGSPEIGLMWRDAIWLFESEASRARFEMNPQAYAPRYGGYCAYAMAEGALASSVPEAFTLHGDRLYLNYSLPVRERWRSDMAGYIAEADAHWPEVLG